MNDERRKGGRWAALDDAIEERFQKLKRSPIFGVFLRSPIFAAGTVATCIGIGNKDSQQIAIGVGLLIVGVGPAVFGGKDK